MKHHDLDFELEADFNDLSAEEFLYNRSGPWPQPAAHHPLGTVPSVLHLPMDEMLSWWLKIGSRYVIDLITYPFIALMKAWRYGGLKEMSDEDFVNYFLHTAYSKYLVRELTIKNIQLFSDFLQPEKEYLMADFSAMELLKPNENIYCEKSIALFEIQNKTIKIVAINLRDYIVTPQDGDLWALGKFIVMQGASVHLNVAEHPKLHFPMDAINAVTKTALPKKHILFQLLYPHLELTLSLNYQVLNNPTSLLENKWWMIYSPFPATPESLRNLMVIGYCGLKENPSYQKYKYPLEGPRKIHADFGVFHEQYYPAFYDFAEKVLEKIPQNDPLVSRWANYIHHMMPSFPDGTEIWKENNLTKAVAVLIWDLTLGHAADHRTYSEIPIYHNPMRLRVSSPITKDSKFSLDKSKAVSVLDQTKWLMANRLFYETWNVTNLTDVKYEFADQSLQKCSLDFQYSLKRIEESLRTKNYMPVNQIPSSIQY